MKKNTHTQNKPPENTFNGRFWFLRQVEFNDTENTECLGGKAFLCDTALTHAGGKQLGIQKYSCDPGNGTD